MDAVNVKDIKEIFFLVVRYVASGFPFISLFCYYEVGFTELVRMGWLCIIWAFAAGVIIYGIHTAFIDDLWYLVSIMLCLRINSIIEIMPEELIINSSSYKVILNDYYGKYKNIFWGKLKIRKLFVNIITLRKISFYLTVKRYERDVMKNNTSEKALHERLENRQSILAFIYTSSYSFICLPAYYFFWGATTRLNNSHISLFIILGFVQLFCAWYLDYRLTKYEFYLVKRLDLKLFN